MNVERAFGADREWTREPSAAPAVLAALRDAAPLALPEDFYLFYAHSNGGTGELGIEPGWFALWRAEGRVAIIAFIGGEPIVIADSFGAFAEAIGVRS